MSIVRVIHTAVVYDEENLTHVPLREGESFDSQHPLVKKFPSLFEAEFRRGVEQATANPGERRK